MIGERTERVYKGANSQHLISNGVLDREDSGVDVENGSENKDTSSHSSHRRVFDRERRKPVLNTKHNRSKLIDSDDDARSEGGDIRDSQTHPRQMDS